MIPISHLRAILYVLLCSCVFIETIAQPKERNPPKVVINYNTNIETYFIAEKLAVEHIGDYVFSNKTTDFSHQPMVVESFKHFRKYKDTPSILRITNILRTLKPILNDNAPIVEFLLYKKPFPLFGDRLPFKTISLYDVNNNPSVLNLLNELEKNLNQFYQEAKVGDFLQKNNFFYQGAIKEVKKDVNNKVFPYMESYYGEHFSEYEIYVTPTMPITPGDDNYRGFGPTLTGPNGKVSTMVISSSRMLPVKQNISDYQNFGYDNPDVTRLLVVHELGHSFVNPYIPSFHDRINRDSVLFTSSFKDALKSSYIGNWEICIIEHFVRLGEIRIATAMNDSKEADRLRKIYVKDMNFVLIPLLEDKIKLYESNRNKYPNFRSFIPELLNFISTVSPKEIDLLLRQSK